MSNSKDVKAAKPDKVEPKSPKAKDPKEGVKITLEADAKEFSAALKPDPYAEPVPPVKDETAPGGTPDAAPPTEDENPAITVVPEPAGRFETITSVRPNGRAIKIRRNLDTGQQEVIS